MEITWEADMSSGDFAGFLVSRSNEIDNGFVQLTEDPLPSNQFTLSLL